MKLIYADIEVNAEIDKVWEFVSDIQNYHEWSPYFLGLRSKTGDITEMSQRVRGYFKSEKTGVLMYNANITKLDKYHMAWKGKIIIPISCFGETHIIVEDFEGKAKLTFKKEFSGLLHRLLSKRYYENLENGFKAMCEEAKKRIENPEAYVKEEEKEATVEEENNN